MKTKTKVKAGQKPSRRHQPQRVAGARQAPAGLKVKTNVKAGYVYPLITHEAGGRKGRKVKTNVKAGRWLRPAACT